MVGQVKIVGILMIFNGLSIVLLGGGIAAIGIFILRVPPPPGGGPGPEAIAVFYIAWGALVLACGAVNAVAGFLVVRFRGRVFGLVALFANIVVILSCPLAITAIGMMVYGLIALFNRDVVRAFDMVARGASPEEAVARFTRSYGDARDDYDEFADSRRGWDEARRQRPEDEDDRRENELEDPR